MALKHKLALKDGFLYYSTRTQNLFLVTLNANISQTIWNTRWSYSRQQHSHFFLPNWHITETNALHFSYLSSDQIKMC